MYFSVHPRGMKVQEAQLLESKTGLWNITQFKVYLKALVFPNSHASWWTSAFFFRKGGAYGMILWTKDLFVFVLCKRLASNPFHALFPLQHKCTHTHTCPQHFTPAPCSIMNIFMSGRVLREIPCIKLNTLLSCLSDRCAWRRHWKTTQVGLLTALYFSLPWERAKRKKKM